MNGLDFGTAIGLIKGLGSPDPAVIESAVSDWLDGHPEATTTVQDGSITKAKLDSNLQGTVNDVADLKSHITSVEDAIDYTLIELNLNKSINTNSSAPILPANIANETGWCCCCVSCSPGDVFGVTGMGGNGTRLWAFSASDGARIVQSDGALTGTDIMLVAPANSAYFAFNANMTKPYNVYKGQKTTKAISDLHEEIIDIQNIFPSLNLFDASDTEDGYLNTSTGKVTSSSSYTTSGYIPVEPLTSYAGNFYRNVCFYDKGKRFIGYASTNVFTTIAGTYYIRIGWQNSLKTASEIVLNKGSAILVENKYAERISESVYSAERFYKKTDNLFDERLVLRGKALINSGAVGIRYADNDAYDATALIPVTAGEPYSSNFGHVLQWYKNDGTYLSSASSPDTAIAPENAYFAALDTLKTNPNIDRLMFVHGNTLPAVYTPMYVPSYNVPSQYVSGVDKLTPWSGKNAVFYGDSITYNCTLRPSLNWIDLLKQHFSLGNAYIRGIAGQTYLWNDYLFLPDEYGNVVENNTPDSTTHGCFCSWERIAAMIPDAIKDSIDVIVTYGGTNDFYNHTADCVWTEPVWSANNVMDTAWANSSAYNGGDFDLSTFSGAIVSTIMKLQARCPQARIIVVTPGPLFTPADSTKPMTVQGISILDVIDVEKKASRWMSAPVIDIMNHSNVTPFNWGDFMDGSAIHPNNTTGEKYVASAMISGFNTIFPKIT